LGIVLTASENGTGGEARGRGSYANQQGPFGPGNRHYPYSTNTTINPNVYSTIATTNVPHGVGEVWASMLWEMYWNFVDRYGYNPDLYQDWESGGNNLALQLVLDGMKLQPCSPGFVDGRDAILAADVALTGGVNQCAIWEGFAKRGLGLSALQGSSASATDGSEAFNVPSSCRYVTRLDDPTPNGCSVGDCSLREAILAANNNAGIDTIQFTVDGTFNIEISGTGENAAATGDFDITDDLVIWGNGAGKTFIDGNGLDRVFEVHGDEVHFRRLTIQDGFVDAGAGFSSGAGIRNSGGNVTLQDVIVQFNSVVESGGTAVGAGISNLFSTAQMSLDRVSVIRNEAQGRAGIYNQDAVMTIENSTISSNSTSTSTGAGIYNYAFGVGSAEMTIRHTTIATNEGPAGFAALHTQNGSGTAVLTIEKSIIADAYTGLNCSNNGGLWTSEGYNLDDDGSCNLTEPTDQSSTVVKLLGRGTSASDLPTHVLAYDSPARDIIPAQNRYHPERDQNGTSRALGTLSDAGAVEAMPCRHDAYGYEMCLVLEAFTELTGGTILTLGDDDFTQVSLPFPFTFYGETHTALFVGSNGYITFGSGSTSRFETEFPNPGTPNNMIAGWWEDLNPNEGASEISYGTAGGGEFVVQFKNLEHYNGGNASTFQIILFPDNHAEVRYEFMSTDFETHSAGIENQGGDIGLSFHYDTRAIPFGTTVRYTPPDYAYLASAFQKVFFLDENLNPVRNFATLDDNVGGITTDGSYIYVAESDTQTIDVFDYAGILINQIAVPINSNFYRGLEFVEGELAVLTNGGYIQFHDPSSGRLLRTIPAQALVSGGIAFDGQLLWQLSGSGLVGTNPADGSVVSTIPNPLTNCPLSGQALTADAYGVLTMGCVSGQWYRLMSSDGTILAQGLNNVSMYGLKRIPHAHHQPDWNAPTDTALTLESSYTDTITITIQNENAGNLLWNLVEGNANLQNFGDETRLIERQNHPLLSPNGFAELPSHILLTPDLGIQAFGTELINDFFAMFDVGSAETLTNLSAFSDSVWAGDFGLGDHSFTYGINSTTGQLVKIDVSNGTITNVGAISAQAGHFWSGMATDPTTGIIYASSYNYPANTASYLYTINTSTGAATAIGNIYGAGGVIAIAFDNDGQLYGIDIAKDVLARIDKSTAKSETVGDLNYDANLAQGMDYDPVTETMYIAAYVNVQGGEWRTVNLETGLTALISDIGSSDPGGNNQFGWLAVQPPTITCTSSDIPWASVMGAANGLILPENSGDVLVEIDARTLNAGAYSGTLCFNTNDPDEPSVEYTINLTVTCDDLPIAPTDLTIQHGGSDILLDWTGGGADDYIIYRANIPYFIPSAFYGIDISVPTSYTDVGAGNAGNNYYYKIGGYKNCSNLGANSTDHVGKFEFGIVAGTP
jgi:CSLREA domain-containing protein